MGKGHLCPSVISPIPSSMRPGVAPQNPVLFPFLAVVVMDTHSVLSPFKTEALPGVFGVNCTPSVVL